MKGKGNSARQDWVPTEKPAVVTIHWIANQLHGWWISSTGDLRRFGALLTTGWARSSGSPDEWIHRIRQLTPWRFNSGS
jgi:hypothetical protein